MENESNLDEPQQFHLNYLKERFNHHSEDQMYPFTFALEDWINGEDGADLEDKEFTLIINIFTVWALEQTGKWNE